PVNAFHAVTAAHGSVAASSNDKCAGIDTRASSLRTTNSVNMPSREPPICGAYSHAKGPSIQCGNMAAITLSPTFTRVTPLPTAVTSPAPSETGTTSGFTGNG